MKAILHVWTKDKATPWIIHYNGKDYLATDVIISSPSSTRSEGHTPCANWYIEIPCDTISILDNGTVILYNSGL